MKISSALCFTLFLGALSSAAHADRILGIFGGISQWQMDVSGELGEGDSTASLSSLGLDEENALSLWVALEHPIPVIPNIHLSTTDIKTSGNGSSEAFSLNGVAILPGDTVNTLDLQQIDATLYYQFLDNIVSLDGGLTIRMYDGSVDISTEDGSELSQADIELAVPMLYLGAQVDFPLTGLFASASSKYISYEDNKVQELSVALGYEYSPVPLIGLGLKGGYKQFSLAIDEEDEIYVDATMEGMFIEAFVHF